MMVVRIESMDGMILPAREARRIRRNDDQIFCESMTKRKSPMRRGVGWELEYQKRREKSAIPKR